MKRELVNINLKVDGSFEPIINKHSGKYFISNPQLIQLLVFLMDEGMISEAQIKARLLRGL